MTLLDNLRFLVPANHDLYCFESQYSAHKHTVIAFMNEFLPACSVGEPPMSGSGTEDHEYVPPLLLPALLLQWTQTCMVSDSNPNDFLTTVTATT